MKTQILEILTEVRPDCDFENSNNFLEDFWLDSFEIIEITEKLENVFGIKIDTAFIIPQNYESAQAIEELIKKCRDNA
ncbi:MAG: phosphopantetheine-binding protein [Clostridium sp.]|jgi:acyl carrier protein|nr:phosphopantetheine-binding protein [Clostridium sp.]